MLLKSELPPEAAERLFESDDLVKELISSIKWEEGYSCRNCGHQNYCAGKTPFSRRCTRCKKEESATAHTIFHNVKFPLRKAFYIAYHVCVLHEYNSAGTYSDKLEINQMTCWRFRKRIQKCIQRQAAGRSGSLKDIILNYPEP